jgi:hypothetical protein
MANELDRLLGKVKALSPAALKKARAEHRLTHCKHGRVLTAHCPWCYIGTAEYKQALADGMRTVLD